MVDAAAADDLAQEALRIALARRPTGLRHPRAWLATVARRLLGRETTAMARRNERERAVALAEALPGADEAVARLELQHSVSAALLALAEPWRTTLVLRFVDELPPRTIAARMGVPVETVRTRTRRALELLRERLTAARGTPPRQWAIALVGLLDGGLRATVRRAVEQVAAAKAATAAGGAAGTSAAAAGGGAAVALAMSGALFMSAKLKLAAAVVLVAGGSWAVARWATTPELPRTTAEAGATADLDTAKAAAVSGAPSLAAPAPVAPSAERAADATRPSEAGREAPATAMRCSVRGRVVAADGRPVVDALVLLERGGDSSARCGSLASLCGTVADLVAECVDGDATSQQAAATETSRRLLHARSDDDGRFRFEGVAASPNSNLAALHPVEGLAVRAGLLLDPAAPLAEQELVLPGGLIMVGDVKDEQGAPIAGARVMFTAWSGTGQQRSGSTLGMVTTGADGRYRSYPWPSRDLTVSCYAQGYQSGERWQVTIHADEREHREDFTLAPLVRREGAIVRADGSPAGLRLVERELLFCASSIEPTPDVGDPKMMGGGELDRERDRWSTDSERVRWVSLWCERTLLGKAAVTEESPAPDLVVDLALLPAPRPKRTLVFEVVDGANGAPVASYAVEFTRTVVEAQSDRGKTLHRQVDDEHGRCEFSELEDGRYDVVVRADGYAPKIATLAAPRDPLAAPQTIELRAATAALAGVVVDQAGQPCAGIFIDLLTPDGSVALPWPEYRVTSNSAGAFAYAAVPPGDYLVAASPPQRRAEHGLAPAVAAARGGDTDVRVTMAPAVRVEVAIRFPTGVFPMYQCRVRDESGRPVFDHTRPGAWTLCAGESQTLWLAEGVHTVEILGERHASAPVRFHARDGAKVEVEVTARAEE